MPFIGRGEQFSCRSKQAKAECFHLDLGNSPQNYFDLEMMMVRALNKDFEKKEA